MNIMMIALNFPPEINSASHLIFDLGSEFVRRGHSVTVVTGYPSYSFDPATLPEKYKSGLWMRETTGGIEVVRSRTLHMPRHIPVLRGIDQLAMAFGFSLAALLLPRKRPDVVLVYSPPMFLGLSGWVMRMFRGAKVVLNVQDLFPQNAIDLGVLKSSTLIGIFRRIESFLYRKLDAVAVHSGGNRDHVVRCGGKPDRTFVILNPVDTKNIVPGNRNSDFRKQHGIGDEQSIVSFAGVLGYAQDLDTVIDAASAMKVADSVVFYIVGDGVEKPRLMEKAEGAKNIRFLPMLERDQYLGLLHASDVCLVTLRKEMKTPVVPGKIMSIMAAGRPLVASLPLDGDAPGIIEDARCGKCVEAGQPARLAEAITAILADPALAGEYSKNGRAYVEAHCSVEGCASAYERTFNEVTRRNNV